MPIYLNEVLYSLCHLSIMASRCLRDARAAVTVIGSRHLLCVMRMDREVKMMIMMAGQLAGLESKIVHIILCNVTQVTASLRLSILFL